MQLLLEGQWVIIFLNIYIKSCFCFVLTISVHSMINMKEAGICKTTWKLPQFSLPIMLKIRIKRSLYFRVIPLTESICGLMWKLHQLFWPIKEDMLRSDRISKHMYAGVFRLFCAVYSLITLGFVAQNLSSQVIVEGAKRTASEKSESAEHEGCSLRVERNSLTILCHQTTKITFMTFFCICVRLCAEGRLSMKRRNDETRSRYAVKPQDLAVKPPSP